MKIFEKNEYIKIEIEFMIYCKPNNLFII